MIEWRSIFEVNNCEKNNSYEQMNDFKSVTLIIDNRGKNKEREENKESEYFSLFEYVVFVKKKSYFVDN